MRELADVKILQVQLCASVSDGQTRPARNRNPEQSMAGGRAKNQHDNSNTTITKIPMVLVRWSPIMTMRSSPGRRPRLS